MTNSFSIFVTGDAGYDLFTFAADGTHSERPARSSSGGGPNPGRYVPSGAPFLHHVLQERIQHCDIKLLLTCSGTDTDKIVSLPVIENHFPQSKERQGIRVLTFGESGNSSHGAEKTYYLKQVSDACNLIVLHDAGRSWSNETRISQTTQERSLKHSKIILVNVKTLPEVREFDPDDAATVGRQDETAQQYPIFRSRLWQHLTTRRSTVGCIVSLATLRQAGAAVTYGLSWEQTVEDFAAELHLFPRLRALSQFAHLFIRIETEGLIHIRNMHPDAGRRFEGRLYFAPDKAGADRPGRIIGKNTLLIASLAHQLRQETLRAKPAATGPTDEAQWLKPEHMQEALRSGLRDIIMIDKRGYNIENVLKEDPPPWQLIKDLMAAATPKLAPGKEQEPREKEEPQVISVKIPDYGLSEPAADRLRPTKRWHILDETLEDAPVHRINIAVAIVQAGLKSVLNRRWDPKESNFDKDLWQKLTRVEYWNPHDLAPDFVTLQDGYPPAMPAKSLKDLPIIKGTHEKGFDLAVPIAKFGALVVAEREQIEALCSIRNLLDTYVQDRARHDKPISIAVFASPGGGKSFTVREIAKTLKFGTPLEYNVAQFRTVDDLAHALHEVEQKSRKEPPPLVFFDEFDCVFDNEKLGWLKYFLAPMQDGKFYSSDLTMSVDIGRAVFVFAGGVYDSFEKFVPSVTPPDERLGYVFSEAFKQRGEEFKEAKGPDFVSRLRGYIDVPAANAEPGRGKHFIRRAIQLRGLLEKLELIDNGEQAKLDEAVIYALLTVDRYHHELRSMEAVLRMCRPTDDRILVSSLPAPAQMDMHVDAEEFFVRLYRGRKRTEPFALNMVEKIDKVVESADASDTEIGRVVAVTAKRLRENLDSEDLSLLQAKIDVLSAMLKERAPTLPIGKLPPDGQTR